MTNFQIFIEQVKYISILRASTEKKSNTQTLHHALTVDESCIEKSSGKIYDQAYQFVELMIKRGQNQETNDPSWLKYRS